jgi:hypothetical protein
VLAALRGPPRCPHEFAALHGAPACTREKIAAYAAAGRAAASRPACGVRGGGVYDLEKRKKSVSQLGLQFLAWNWKDHHLLGLIFVIFRPSTTSASSSAFFPSTIHIDVAHGRGDRKLNENLQDCYVILLVIVDCIIMSARI